MGRFKPGQPKPLNSGRVAGTPNKRSSELAIVLDKIKLDLPGRLKKLLPKLTPEKQADVLLELMSYVYPKRKAIEQTHIIEQPPPDEGPIIVSFVSARDEPAKRMTWLNGELREISSIEGHPGITEEN